jgi:hypothetical protein
MIDDGRGNPAVRIILCDPTEIDAVPTPEAALERVRLFGILDEPNIETA